MKNKYFVHESSYIDENVKIGEGTKIWYFCHIQSGSKIGKNCSFGQNVNIGNNVIIGNNVKIQNNVSVYEGIKIENGVFCGPSCVFTNDLTPRSMYPKGHENYKKTVLKKGCTIGANSTIVCGNIIGRFGMVGAGSVVTRDVKDYELVIGNPAKHYKWACECGEILDKSLTCKKCKRQYKETKNGLVEIKE